MHTNTNSQSVALEMVEKDESPNESTAAVAMSETIAPPETMARARATSCLAPPIPYTEAEQKIAAALDTTAKARAGKNVVPTEVLAGGGSSEASDFDALNVPAPGFFFGVLARYPCLVIALAWLMSGLAMVGLYFGGDIGLSAQGTLFEDSTHADVRHMRPSLYVWVVVHVATSAKLCSHCALTPYERWTASLLSAPGEAQRHQVAARAPLLRH